MGKAKNTSVIGIINTLRAMKGFIAYDLPEELAEEFLRSTLEDSPRPPINTGALRRSGAVYIGAKLHMTTEMLADKHPQLEALLYPTGDDLHPVELQKDSVMLSKQAAPTATLRQRQLEVTNRISGSMSGTSLRGNISVVYRNPVAALMHEWTGSFSDRLSGAHFVSAKATQFLGKTQTRLTSEFKSRIRKAAKK